MPLHTSGEIRITDLKNEFGGQAPYGLSAYYKGGALVDATRPGTATRAVSATISGGDGWGIKSGNLGTVATSISIPTDTVFSITIPHTYSGRLRVTSWVGGAAASVQRESTVTVGGTSLGTTSISRAGLFWEHASGSINNLSVSSSGFPANNRTLSGVGSRNSVGNHNLYSLSTVELGLPSAIPTGSTAWHNFSTLTGSVIFTGTTTSASVIRFGYAGAYNDVSYAGGAPNNSGGWTQTGTQTYDQATAINAGVPLAGTDVGGITGNTNEIKLSHFYGAEEQ